MWLRALYLQFLSKLLYKSKIYPTEKIIFINYYILLFRIIILEEIKKKKY